MTHLPGHTTHCSWWSWCLPPLPHLQKPPRDSGLFLHHIAALSPLHPRHVASVSHARITQLSTEVRSPVHVSVRRPGMPPQCLTDTCPAHAWMAAGPSPRTPPPSCQSMFYPAGKGASSSRCTELLLKTPVLFLHQMIYRTALSTAPCPWVLPLSLGYALPDCGANFSTHLLSLGPQTTTSSSCWGCPQNPKHHQLDRVTQWPLGLTPSPSRGPDPTGRPSRGLKRQWPCTLMAICQDSPAVKTQPCPTGKETVLSLSLNTRCLV